MTARQQHIQTSLQQSLQAPLGHAGILAFTPQTLAELRPRLLALEVGESTVSTSAIEMGQREEIKFQRLNIEDARMKLLKPECGPMKLCPRCDGRMRMHYKRNTSDGFCGIQYCDHICMNELCGLNIERYYEGYGDIFAEN